MKQIIVIMCLSLMACGGDSGWPKKDQDKYLDFCTSEFIGYASASDISAFCDCTLGKFQDQYATLDALVKDANHDPLPHEIIDIVGECEPK